MDKITKIFKVTQDGQQEEVAMYVNKYSVKENLISFIEQKIHNNYKTWEYSKDIQGIKETKHGGFLFEDKSDVYIAR